MSEAPESARKTTPRVNMPGSPITLKPAAMTDAPYATTATAMAIPCRCTCEIHPDRTNAISEPMAGAAWSSPSVDAFPA